METQNRWIVDLTSRLYEGMLRWYPPRFRREFAGEIHAVFLERMDEPGGKPGVVLQEMAGLTWSILRERWHERNSRKGGEMKEQNPILAGPGGAAAFAAAPEKGFFWLVGWVLMNFLAIPAAMLLATPFSMPYIWLFELGVRAGWWAKVAQTSLVLPGFCTAFALLLATAQWLLLRRLLPRPGRWFAATALGTWLGGLAAGGIVLVNGQDLLDTAWLLPVVLAAGGLMLGLAQWLALRRDAPRTGWMVLIDTIAFASVAILPHTSITNGAEMARTIGILALPGALSGLGVLLLLRVAQAGHERRREIAVPRVRGGAGRIVARISLGLVVAAAAFFFLIWAYAASQLALAKSSGVYPTVEEAVIGHNSTGWGGANVVSITDVRAGPNRHDGSQPHVWFGSATILLDRIPTGYHRSTFHGGSFYIHTREGWVFVGEGAFPEFIGWVMALYNMEGVQ